MLKRQTANVQRNYRAVCTVLKAGYLCLALCFLFSSARSPSRSPLSPAFFLPPLNCFPDLGCSPPPVGLPGGRIRHPPSAVVALAVLAGAGPGGLAFAEQRIPVRWMVQPRLLLLGWEEFMPVQWRTSPFILCCGVCVLCQQDGEYSLFSLAFRISIFIACLLPLGRREGGKQQLPPFEIINMSM